MESVLSTDSTQLFLNSDDPNPVFYRDIPQGRSQDGSPKIPTATTMFADNSDDNVHKYLVPMQVGKKTTAGPPTPSPA